MHVPCLNFKSCRVAISEGPYVAVGSSSTATPEIRTYVLLTRRSFETLVCPISPTLGQFLFLRHILIFQNIMLHCFKSLSNS